MKSLDSQTIAEILKRTQTEEKREIHRNEIESSRKIDGIGLARRLSGIIDEAVLGVLEAMDLSEDATIVAVGSTGRGDPTPKSDLDLICYVPKVDGFEGTFTDIYRETMWGLHKALDLAGDPIVWVPGDFRTDDLLNIASMNIDARLMYGGKKLTMEEIQERVRKVCKPIVIASKHELVLEKFKYTRDGLRRNEFSSSFDLKNDRGGLRHLQHVLWFVAAIESTSLQNLYKTIETESPQVYNALDLILHIRSWLHLRKKGKNSQSDILSSIHWPELQKQFGDNIIEEISNARATIISYERSRIREEKKKGMVIGDGTRYGLTGLEIDKKSWTPKTELVIRLLINAQETGLQISDSDFTMLENEARHKMQGHNENWAKLLKERGDFSTTVARLMRFGIIENVFPQFNVIKSKTYHHTHRHADINRIGRVMKRLENLENISKEHPNKDIIIDRHLDADIITDRYIRDIYGELTMDELAGIRIALTCKDIPTFAEIYRKDYFQNLGILHPSLVSAIGIAEHLVRKHRILFDCALIDDWYDKRELERIAKEIGSLSQLDALLVYTCAMLDYGKAEYYTKSQWGKVFTLYRALKEELESADPKKCAEYGKQALVKKMHLSPEQLAILDSAHQNFLHSRYLSASKSLVETMKCLENAKKKGEPQITISRSPENTIRIIVSAQYNDNLPAIITGTCLENDIAIDDAEIHILDKENPVAVLFIEGNFSSMGVTNANRERTITQLKRDLQEKISKGEISDRDPADILRISEPSYLLEMTNRTENYKLMVTAKKNTPGFLYALTRIIAESGVKILSFSVYTHPGNNENPPLIEDIFILEPENIDNLRSAIGIRAL